MRQGSPHLCGKDVHTRATREPASVGQEAPVSSRYQDHLYSGLCARKYGGPWRRDFEKNSQCVRSPCYIDSCNRRNYSAYCNLERFNSSALTSTADLTNGNAAYKSQASASVFCEGLFQAPPFPFPWVHQSQHQTNKCILRWPHRCIKLGSRTCP